MTSILRKAWAARRALLFYGALLVGGSALAMAVQGALPDQLPMGEAALRRVVVAALLVYVVTVAIPFVPGAEIGFALLMLFGGEAALGVFLGMVGALVLAYWVARLVPLSSLGHLLGWLGLSRAAALVQRLDGANMAQRQAMLEDALPRALSGRLIRYRYLVLIVLLNTPGNSLIGGGGGLAFLAGSSGLFPFPLYLAAVLCAVAPMPLLFYLA